MNIVHIGAKSTFHVLQTMTFTICWPMLPVEVTVCFGVAAMETHNGRAFFPFLPPPLPYV